MRQKSIKLYITLSLIFLISACQPGQSPLIKPTPVQLKVVEEETAGDYQAAALKYLSLAQTHSGELQALYQLKAAQLFAQLNQHEQALQTRNAIDSHVLSANKLIDYKFLSAQLYLLQAQAQDALQVLDDIDEQQLNDEQKKALYSLRINAYEHTENWLEKSNTHLKLDKLLLQAEQTNNREQLWQALMQLSPQVLDLFNPGIPPQAESGWFALAYLIKAYQTQPEVLQVALEDWKRSYPNHPADPALYESVLAAGTHLPAELSSIAVLLPASGPYAEAANVIKEGLIAAHFNQPQNSQLQFFDITDAGGQSNVIQQYQYAVDSGADVVIGPLQKSSVDELALAADLPVPVLALNRIDQQLSRPNLFQFGLAPEDDAISIANFATDHTYQRAVVLTPEGEWGERIANAFNQQWRQNGGQILYQSSYTPSDSDFRDTLIPFMGLDVSKQRYQQLKSLLGRSMDFEPRRRQDIDFIFLVAKPLKARQLVPQLKFHRSGDLPIIATSHAYSGEENPQQDIDLNALIITDMPWILADKNEQDPVYQALQSQADKYNGSLRRLFALGVDAYRLLPQLNVMSREQTIQYPGATGILSINGYGQIERKMPWAQFKQGSLIRLQ